MILMIFAVCLMINVLRFECSIKYKIVVAKVPMRRLQIGVRAIYCTSLLYLYLILEVCYGVTPKFHFMFADHL